MRASVLACAMKCPARRSARPRSTAASSNCSTGARPGPATSSIRRPGPCTRSAPASPWSRSSRISISPIVSTIMAGRASCILRRGSPSPIPRPGTRPWRRRRIGEGREVLAAGGAFVLERWQGAEASVGTDSGAPIWLIPLENGASADGTAARGRLGLGRARTNADPRPGSFRAARRLCRLGGQIGVKPRYLWSTGT